jgi:hypothetical protein
VYAASNDLGVFAEAVNGPGVSGGTSVSAEAAERTVVYTSQVPLGTMMDFDYGLGITGSVSVITGSGSVSLDASVIIQNSSGLGLACGLDFRETLIGGTGPVEQFPSAPCQVANGQYIEVDEVFGVGLSPQNVGNGR